MPNTAIDHLILVGGRASQHSSPAARTMATAHFLDAVSLMVGAATHPMLKRLESMLEVLAEADGPVGILSLPCRASNLSRSVWVDAIACHVDESDSFHRRAAIAPAGAVIPGAFALAGAIGQSGRRLTDAILGGFEVTTEAALMFGGAALYAQSWWPTALVGSLGSAAACSILLELDEAQTANALAIAGSGLGGLLAARDLAESHYMMLGSVAQRGVEAAYAAALGVTGAPTLLDDPAAAAIRRAVVPDVRPLTHLEECEFKTYPCANPLQSVVHTIKVAIEDGLVPGGVASIRVLLPASALAYVTNGPHVDSPAEAARNLRFVVSAALEGRESDLSHYRRPAISPTYRDIQIELGAVESHKVGGSPLPDQSLTIHLKSGDTLELPLSLPNEGPGAVFPSSRVHADVEASLVSSQANGAAIAQLDEVANVRAMRESLLESLCTE